MIKKVRARATHLPWIVCLIFLLSYLSATLAISNAAVSKVRIFYFYAATCNKCTWIKEQFLPKVQRKFQNKLEIKFLEVTDLKNFGLLLDLEKAYQRKIEKTPPLIIIGNDVLEGKTVIMHQLEPVIQKYLETGGCDWPQIVSLPKKDHARAHAYYLVAEKYSKLTLLAVIGAGLLDALNPCAFTTLIFLISYLALIGKKRRELLWSGFSFTLGIFIAYFLAGLGILGILNKFSFFTTTGKLFSDTMAIMLILLSMVSFYDYLQIKQGKIKEIKLQLGDYFKKKIHRVIREKSRARTYLIASFTMGFLVSLWEFPCTGQIYFPIIFMLRQMSSFRISALLYLFTYNIIFILPVIAVFTVVYRGVTSQTITTFMLKHAGKVKLLTVLLYLGLAALIIAIQLQLINK